MQLYINDEMLATSVTYQFGTGCLTISQDAITIGGNRQGIRITVTPDNAEAILAVLKRAVAAVEDRIE